MAATEKFVETFCQFGIKLQRLVTWKPQVKAMIVWLTFLTGSFIHDFFPLKPCSLSNRRSIFNVYFVKKGWGWTAGLMLCFILFISKFRHQTDLKRVGKSLLRICYATAAWFTLTTAFEYLEELTGVCEGDASQKTKRSCINRKAYWNGFDISGHCFLLSFCILIINQELLPFVGFKDSVLSKQIQQDGSKGQDLVIFEPLKFKKDNIYDITNILSILLTLLMVLWEFMLFITCVYYHTLHQKFFGICFGILAWYCLYYVLTKLKHPLLVPSSPLSFEHAF